MKLTLVSSALASFFVLLGSSAFSVDILSDVNIFNLDAKQVDKVNEKNFSDKKNLDNRENNLVKVGRALVSGQAISYMWASADKSDNIFDISGNMDNYGMSYDAILRLGAEIKSGDSGTKYGADFQVAIPSVKGRNFERKAALNRGSRLFAATQYGNFSVGYQEGVESIMKLDSSNIIAGDESNSWTQHLRGVLSEKKNALGYSMYPFLFSAGLYSENVFRNDDNIDITNGSKDFINNLPLRMSYLSPSFMGLRFGVSYSPIGYKFDSFSTMLEQHVIKEISVMTKMPKLSADFQNAGTVDLTQLISKLEEGVNLGENCELDIGTSDRYLEIDLPRTSDILTDNEGVRCHGTIDNSQARINHLSDVGQFSFYVDLQDNTKAKVPFSKLTLKNPQVSFQNLSSINKNLNVDLGTININDSSNEDCKSKLRQRIKDVKDSILFGTKYEHIFSGSIAYDYDFHGFKFSTSVVGEYARPRLYFNASNYNIYPEGYNLQGVSIGSVLSYKNVNFAAAYGYLGHSGFVKYYSVLNDAANTTTDSVQPVNDVRKLYERSNTYYLDAALGYQYHSYYISVGYFKSSRSGNILQDINLGIEYNLLKSQSKMKCKLFGNYHYYKFSEVSIVNDKVCYHKEVKEPQTTCACRLAKREFEEKKKSGFGNIFLVGAKLEF
ncbi:hypothetical protein DRF75_00540 [Ehrlichia minasensis]|uniref:Porin n=1 Tax=Ehrlichia minasensis TaxID=1242993 RepID=A0A4Q6I5H7_9RICK|nr:hypothetical protein [Ehrlichia minasensis]RZB13185.1 hypothetical protein DRF75_00540 [Ehrlichia minasensis]